MKIRGDRYRSRGMAHLDKTFGDRVIESSIKGALRNGRDVKALEIGFGEGRVLMELRKAFPDIELIGINKAPYHVVRNRKDLQRTALYYELFGHTELASVELPKIFFYDAQRLKLDDESVDVIYSQVSIHYIRDKSKFIEEAWRVLKMNGRAYLHIDTKEDDPPPLLDLDTPRFVINGNYGIFPLEELITEVRASGFDIQYKTKGSKVLLLMNKNTKKRLSLGLEFQRTSSFKLGEDEEYYWGYRSIYKFKSGKRCTGVSK